MFELPDNKNIGKLVSKHDLFSLDQANFSSDPSQILILQYPHPCNFPASLAISVKFCPGQLKSLFNAILIMFFIGFPIFFSTPFDHMLQLLDIQNHMSTQANQIYYQAIYKS